METNASGKHSDMRAEDMFDNCCPVAVCQECLQIKVISLIVIYPESVNMTGNHDWYRGSMWKWFLDIT